jgi:pyruvate dehydrogenase E2 component (dihydrolipoamide acetyltransferase)
VAELREVSIPDIGDFDAVEVIEVLVAPGDSIAAEDSLISLESDKATMEIPSPYDGVVKELKVAIGDKVSEGAAILTMEVAASDGTEAAAPAPEQAAPAEAAAPPATEVAQPLPPAVQAPAADEDIVPYAPDTTAGQKLAHASPSVRRFARELGVTLSQVSGSGPKNRILKDDVQAFVKQAMQSGMSRPTAGAAIPPVPKVDFEKFGEVEVKPLSRIKKISGKHLHACWLNIPHVTQFDEADITELEAFRKGMQEEAARKGVRLTPLVFIMKAVCATLREFPQFNASLDESQENLVLKKYNNIGVAVDTPEGLMVPVIRDVDKKGFYDLAGELLAVSERAREGSLMPADLQGGTFSISSLGGIGGTSFTPIVNAPEVAILGVARSQMKPVWNGTDFVPRLMLPLALSYDHRVIDGADGARFTTHLSRMLTDIRKVLL